MALQADSSQIASRARRLYTDELVKGLPALVGRVVEAARVAQEKPADNATAHRRRDLAQNLYKQRKVWLNQMAEGLRQVLAHGVASTSTGSLRQATPQGLSLVDDDTIDREILTSRLALSIMDRASWEFSDLRSRVATLEQRQELDTHDMLRAHVLARVVLDAWHNSGLNSPAWRETQLVLHEEFALLVEEAYHEVNRWLFTQNVLPNVDLRPFIRRAAESPTGDRDSGVSGASDYGRSDLGGHSTPGPSGYPASRYPSLSGHGGHSTTGGSPTTQPSYGSGGGAPTTGGAGTGNNAGHGAQAYGADPHSRTPFGAGAARVNISKPIAPGRGAVSRPVARAGGGAAQMSSGAAWARPPSQRSDVHEETRLMTRSPGLPRAVSMASEHAEEVMGRLNRLVGRHTPGFAATVQGPMVVTGRLAKAIDHVQHSIQQRLDNVEAAIAASSHTAARNASAREGGGAASTGSSTGGNSSGVGGGGTGGGTNSSQANKQAVAQAAAKAAHAAAMATAPMLLEDLQQRKQTLKQAAETPAERATIEIVAMMFQSILTEERIPAQVRVWFARLQMPVLRVAVSEPDFFATIDHPARRLIDRLGACVMGFDETVRAVGDALEKEIKRIVQVVEAYPDTGRRVFQTVLTEFEKFLEHFFRNENEASKRGVSLAQRVEQRETLAIQYTIELRRMLNEVPVQEGVRQFLFHTWADVLATTAVRFGGTAEETKAMKRAAADLIWSASAKVTREERGEVIRRLPPLLKRLRDGMTSAGMQGAKQDEQIQQLNNSLAAAFTAKAAVIPTERLGELMERLESIEELLPESTSVEIDESMVLDLSGHESSELEVVVDGGSMPAPAMLAWARELMVGSWYMLDYRNRTEPVQLAWHGMHRQLSLFVSTTGRCVLFQQHRLASYLQAGLLVPAQDESLTVRATRSALAKIDADPSRLAN